MGEREYCWRCDANRHECPGCGGYVPHPGGGCRVHPCVSAELQEDLNENRLAADRIV